MGLVEIAYYGIVVVVMKKPSASGGWLFVSMLIDKWITKP